MKVHVGMDTNGLAHSVVDTDASAHDSRVMDKLMHGEEVVVYSDKDYASAAKKDQYEAEGVEWRVDRKVSEQRSLISQTEGLTKRTIGHVPRARTLLISRKIYGVTSPRGIGKNPAYAKTKDQSVPVIKKTIFQRLLWLR